MRKGRIVLRTSWCVTLCMVFALALVSTPGLAAEAPKKVTFVAGTVGGSWYNTAAVMAEILMKEIPGLNVTATSGISLGNVRLVNEGRDAHFGWTYLNSIFKARKVEPPFKKEHMNVRVVLPGMLGSPYLVCNKKAGIKDWGDLIGKRVLTAQLGGANEDLFRKTLALYGITYDDIKKAGGSVNHIAFTQQVTLMKDNRADAILAPAPPNNPHGLVLDLDNTMDINIARVRPDVLQKFCEQNPGYMPYPLDPMYKFLKGLDKPVMVAAGIAVIMTNKDFPDDFVYNVLKAVYTHKERLYKVNRMYTYIKKENLKRGIPDELIHPGALKFMNEAQAGKWD